MKRKREDDHLEAKEGSIAKQQRLYHKLKLGITKVGHAFKIAKGFERQKLGRRRKTAATQDGDKDVNRIDSEIVASKALDTSASARQLFYKTLLKAKAISDHPDVPSEIRQPIKLPSDAASLNVHARLCKSNQVQDALTTAVTEIQSALGLEAESSTTSKKRRVRAKDFKGTVSNDSEAGGDRHHRHEATIQPGRLVSNVSDEDFASFNGRIAPSDGEGSDAEDPEELLTTAATRKKVSSPRSTGYDVEADLSISGSESEPQSLSPEPAKAPGTKRSSFLPSLSMAGYISGSGSDIDDEIDVAPKKNRRGQRARQQIWEQKYGAKATHLQKSDRNKGWDSKRGAVDGKDSRMRGFRSKHRRSSPDYRLGGNAEQLNPREASDAKKKHRDDNGPIHPSWEAAKKAKEKKDAPVTFQGKKITFD